MVSKSNELTLSAVKSAGEAALRLYEENKQLRECLQFVRPYVYGLDRIKMIDAALAGATVQPSVVNERDARDPVVEAQHDETGRMWRGRRSMIPHRYFECVTPSPTKAAP